MSAERQCPECGSVLPIGVPIGQCPNCLLSLGLGIPDDLPGPAKQERMQGQPDPIAINSDPGAKARTFGDYELLEEIARGGMGVVYKARQRSLNRVVALKLILSGQFASKQEVLRFRSEAEAAANLRHPNIVAIYETGESDGQHYFSMEFVEGRSLAEIGRDGPLPAQRAARYAKVIADVIHYAHQQGTLHRDLKPSNVLVGANDQPRVTDFGLAKRALGDFSFTGSSQMLGSPNYMPPEQAGESVGVHPSASSKGRDKLKPELQRARPRVGPYSDVYSLGATLYYLLTGRPPFVAEVLTDTLHQLLNADPVPPRLLNPSVPLDLQTICLKCLEKEPGKRYPTSQALADDLGRFLNDEPIRARPVSRLERAWRWCRRKPTLATLILAVHLVGAMGLAGILWQWRRAETSATNERLAHNVAEGRLYAAQMKLAHAAIKAGRIGGSLTLLQSQQPGPGQPDFRGFEWRYLYRLCESSQSEVLATNASGFSSVEYSPDRRTVVFGAAGGTVEIFDLQRRERLARWHAHNGVIDDLAFHPQNPNWLATASGDDGLLKVWDVARQLVLFSTNSSKGLWANLAFSPRGRFLVSGAPDAQSLNLWELRPVAAEASPELLLNTNLAFLGPAAFSPDERTVALCNPAGGRFGFEVASYDLASGQIVTWPIAHANLIHCIAFSPDGSKLASGGADERVVLWDPANRMPIHTYRTELINVTALTFAPDSQTLIASGWDQNIRSWDLRKPGVTLVLKGHSAGVNAIAISPDGSSLASGGRDGSARLWRLRMEDLTLMAQPPDEFSTLFASEDTAVPIAAAVSPDQVKVAAVMLDNLVVCDLVTGALLASVNATNVFRAKPTRFRSVTFSPDGGRLAVGSEDGMAAFLDAITLQVLKEPIQLHKGQITDIAYGLGGSVLATGGGFGAGVALSEVSTGRIIRSFSAVEGLFPIQAIAVSSDGKLLATGSPQQVVSLWDIASGQLLASHSQKVRFLHCVTFSLDGKLLAFSDELGTIFLWEPGGQRPLRKLVSHAGPVNALTFSPDGRTLASGSMDRTIKLWHPDIDQEVATLEGHSAWIWCVLFAQHGDTLVSGSQDGTLKLWRALPFEKIALRKNAGHTRR